MEHHDEDPDATARAMAADERPTCDHDWARCPFRCESCGYDFAIADMPVRFERTVYRREVKLDDEGDAPLGSLPIAAWGDSAELVGAISAWDAGEPEPPMPSPSRSMAAEAAED